MNAPKILRKSKLIKWVFVAITPFMVIMLTPLPAPLFQDPYATTLWSQEGNLLDARIGADEQWRFPPSDSIPNKLEIAVRLFEDEYFYRHPGVNPLSIARAIQQNIEAGKIVSGGSTLSMQTVRLAFKNQKRTYGQKALEILASLKLELLYSKEEILRTYLDHAPFGGNLVGVNAASYRYFGRPPAGLSWAEIATLAVLPNSPGTVFPGRNHTALQTKRNRLLDKIAARGFIDADQCFLAKEEPLPSQLIPLPRRANHLLGRSIAEGHGQKHIQSSLNARLQTQVTRLVNEHSKSLQANEINNAAALVLEIATGEAKAYVGNATLDGNHGQFVDVITAPRSPGSLLKPILYAAAIDEGLILPGQLLPDIPVFYRGFAPKNFDKEYRGAVPANDALVSSLNVPFVHLLWEYGYEKFHHKLRSLGYQSLTQAPSHYGLSLILGGSETSLWEISSIYAGMVRAYKAYWDRPYRSGYSSQDYHANTYLTREETAGNLGPDGLFKVGSLHYTFESMSQLQRPYEEAGWEYFQSSRKIAWKTGTSYGFRDAWALGFNDNYLVAVWAGNADGEGRPGLTGVSAAAPLLFDIFRLLPGGLTLEETFGEPSHVCTLSGMLASDLCQSTKVFGLPQNLTYNQHCIYHQQVSLNQERTGQVNSSCYEIANIQKENWFVLPAVQAWYYQKYHPSYKKLPAFLSHCEYADPNRSFGLIYPRDFTKVRIPKEQDGNKGQAIFEATHRDPGSLIYWHLDDQYLGTTHRNHQMGIQATSGVHLLTLVDELGTEIRQRFEVIN